MREALVTRPLPFEVPPVHVEALWLRSRGGDAAHAWLREALLRASAKAFEAS